MSTGVILYFASIVLTLILLLWWRIGCESSKIHPGRGHVLILFLLSFAPIYNTIQLIVLVMMFIACRLEGVITLKPNKFNKFWFDKKEELD